MNTTLNPKFGRRRDILTRQVTISLLQTVLHRVSWSVTYDTPTFKVAESQIEKLSCLTEKLIMTEDVIKFH